MRAHPSPLAVSHRHLAKLPRHAPFSHTDHVVTYVAKGSLEMNLGESVMARPGCVLLLPSGIPHAPVSGRDLELWMVRFCPTCFSLDETQPLMTPFRRIRHGALPVVSLPRGRRRRVVGLCRDMTAEWEAQQPESKDLLRSMLQLLLGEILRAMPAAGPPDTGAGFVPDALAFIQREALRPLSLRDVAAAVGHAPAHVAATIKERTGHTVGDWIASVRLAEAASRLIHTSDSVLEIAEAVGWRDQSHFIRQFRKAYSSTPAAWRRRHTG